MIHLLLLEALDVRSSGQSSPSTGSSIAPAISALLPVLRIVLLAGEEFGAQQHAHVELAEEEEDGGRGLCSCASRGAKHCLSGPFCPFWEQSTRLY